MKKLIFCIVALSVVFAVGSAMAFDADDHIKVAPNSKGDVVIFPVVLGVSDEGLRTKIVVTNTSETECAVAKVVFRDGQYSQEILDFLIYLSPTDVWWAEIYYNTAEGKVKVFSTDGSGPSSTVGQTFASVTYPLDQPFVFPFACVSGEIAYCEVIGTWSDGPYTPPVSKSTVKSHFESESVDFTCANILTGHYECYVPGLVIGANRALVFADYDNEEELTPVTPTFLGAAANNNLCEIEAALSKDYISMPYYNVTTVESAHFAVHWHTFITKQSTINSLCVVQSVNGPFWDETLGDKTWIDDNFCVIYSPLYFDLEEGAPTDTASPFSPYTPPPDEMFCWEVNYMFTIPDFIDSYYKEGWVRYAFNSTTSCTPEAGVPDVLIYTGAPDIPTVWLYSVVDGLSIFDAAYCNGTVTYNGALLPYYQYSDVHEQP